MKRSLFCRFAAAVVVAAGMLCFSQTASAQRALAPKGIENPDKWICSAFAKGAVPPFSFEMNGTPSEKFIKTWGYSAKKNQSEEKNTVSYSFTYSDKGSGLQVVADVRGYTDFRAVEWVVNFRNTSKSGRSPQISNIRTADFTLRDKAAGRMMLRYCHGCTGSIYDFSVADKVLAPGSPEKFSPVGGRSSAGEALPYFNLICDGADNGIIFSIGWTGTWNASFAAAEGGVATVKSGLENADFYLNAGEDVRASRVSLFFWKGSRGTNEKCTYMASHNAFRQFMLAHHSHRAGGHVFAPLCGGFDWGDPSWCNEYSCLTEPLAKGIVRRFHQLDIMPEVFWLDAGWYAAPDGDRFAGNMNWYEGAGLWQPDKERFPSGFINISNLIHSFGAEFMVWFEPERVWHDSYLAKEYPQWMLKRAEPGEPSYMFNLGDREACDFLCNYIGDVIEQNGIDHYRQDFNCDASPYWANSDEPGRRGITEMKYVEGLYRYWDYLQKRFPNLHIDNCASGGKRLDLETCSRATPLWRTDYSYGEPNGYQSHTYGINMFLPLSGVGIFKTDEYTARSTYSGATSLSFEVLTADNDTEDMKRIFKEYNAVRSYYRKDYYPLTGFGDTGRLDIWLAYQLHDPETGNGYILAFRRPECQQEKVSVDLQALSPNGTYYVTDCTTGEEKEYYGGDMMNAFVIRSTQPRQAILLKYVHE
ncbi:MAG: alpha-galactosidase [Bacteroidales bacterium]|nr:alpha-galactosidase [Candidatus Equibacterium intestinale]